MTLKERAMKSQMLIQNVNLLIIYNHLLLLAHLFSSLGRGKKSKLSNIDEIFENNKNQLLIDGTYAKSGSKVYFDLADQYNVTKQSMYLAMKRHIMKTLELRDEDIQRDESSEDEYTSISNLNIHPEDSVFCFDLSSVDLFQTDGKTRNGKEIAAVLVDILWDLARLPCCWKFTRLQKPFDEYRMSATCCDCGNYMFSQSVVKKN